MLDSNKAVNSQAAAGATLMRLALSRPVSRQAWREQTAIELKRREEAKRQRQAEESRKFRDKINPIIAGRSPGPEIAWEEPSPAQVVIAEGLNHSATENALAHRLEEEQRQQAEELHAEVQANAAAASESLQHAVDSEAEWWEWYWSTKKNREDEEARREEEAKAAELKRLRARYER